MNELPANLQRYTLQREVRAVKIKSAKKHGKQLTIVTDDNYHPDFNIDADQVIDGDTYAIEGAAGDMLVVDAEGGCSFMTEDEFNATYKKVA